ncbi:MAG: lysophospholipase, partial [Alphaproteobacteria bacterium]|nr:lysophospholipase [Alphaproteobacteria bacterium]
MNHPTPVTIPGRKIGLVLSGGVARGWAHIGAIKTLQKMGYKFDVVAGCSIGAVVGALMLAGKLEALEAWCRGLNKIKIASYLDLNIKSGGLIGGQKLVDEIRRHIGDLRVEDLPQKFVAVSTDLVTGHEVWLQQGVLADVLRASFALPGLFPPSQLQGRWLLDGALVNPCPVSMCRAMGADLIIAINLNADIIGKVRQMEKGVPVAAGFDLLPMMEQTPELKHKTHGLDWLTRRIFHREPQSPSLFGVMTAALNIMLDRMTRSRMAGDPADVHIAPRLG